MVRAYPFVFIASTDGNGGEAEDTERVGRRLVSVLKASGQSSGRAQARVPLCDFASPNQRRDQNNAPAVREAQLVAAMGGRDEYRARAGEWGKKREVGGELGCDVKD